MKRFKFYAILFALVTFVACSDDFVPVLTTDLTTDTFEFTSEGGKQTFLLETNEQWSVEETPEWITVNVTDAPITRAEKTLYESGKKAVTIVVAENLAYEDRTIELTMMSVSGNLVKLTVTQEKSPKLITDLETDQFSFQSEGGKQSFLLDSNEDWTMNEQPLWLTVEVKDADESATRSTSFESGKKEITITAEKNNEHISRSAELILTSLKGLKIELEIIQAKKPELIGYWILSEGYAGQDNSEMAWFDVSTKKIAKKQFKTINGTSLGDTGNAMKMYGSKMYAVISGPGFGTETPEGTSYIEVIDPANGKSIKRVQFTTASGVAAKPRNIIFEGGKAYISSYSNEVVRLDTATLQLDAHATLSGTLAEGLAYNDGKIYVCNSGQGEDNKISVVDAESMMETKIITTAMNPTGIVSVSNGVLYFNTNYPAYTLYKLTTANDEITEIPGFSVADMTYTNNNIYTSSFDWGTYMGEVYQFNTTTEVSTQINLDLAEVGIPMLMEYHIGTINGSEYLYLTGMGEDVVIFDPNTREIKHALKTGVANASGVVAVYK
ncbi:MAG: hypothetical protein GX857_03980 [Bacteroidales bacterium]|jgi:hypothetical protein|nr:hypothetical protein [Bacteroidales bacterium]